MRQFAQFPNGTALYNQYLTQTAIDRYLTENPFNASKALEQINTQYWINCFCDEYILTEHQEFSQNLWYRPFSRCDSYP